MDRYTLRTVEFWHYSSGGEVEIKVAHSGSTIAADPKVREYERPSQTSLRRLMRLLQADVGLRPPNIVVTFWTNGTALTVDAHVYGRLERTPAEQVADGLVYGWMKSSTGPAEMLGHFFEQIFGLPPRSQP